MRNRDAELGELSMRQQGDFIELTLDAVNTNGGFQNQAATRLKLIRPGEESEKETLIVPQTAPGRYSVRIPIRSEGAYFVDLVQTANDQVLLQKSQGLFVGYPAELRLKPSNRELLRL